MWEFLKAGGPVMVLLVLTSIIGLTFIIERGLALRWRRVISAELEDALEGCNSSKEKAAVIGAAQRHPAPASRVILLANEHLNWPKQENIDTVETAARHE